MKKSKKWMSIVLAIFITTSIILTGVYLLELVVPFSRNVVGIENSSMAYYLWVSSAERASYTIKNNRWTNYDNEALNETPQTKDYVNGYFDATSLSENFPIPGLWNSPFNSNYNILDKRSPISFYIKDSNFDIGNLEVNFRIPPEVNYNAITDQIIETPRNFYSYDTDEAILWWVMFWYTNSDEPVTMNWVFKYSDISVWDSLPFSTILWKYERTECTIVEALSNSWACYDKPIIDKDKIILFRVYLLKELLAQNWEPISNLEYKITASNWTQVANKNSIVEAYWISRWFKREVNIQSAQMPAGISSLDFTVLQ